MCRTQAFVFLFLLGLNLPKAKGNCDFLESQKRCVCSLLEQSAVQNYLQCLPATTYELRGGNLERFAGFFKIKPSPEMIDILEALQVSKLVFTDLLVPEILLPAAMEFVFYTPSISELEFVNCTFLQTTNWEHASGLNLKVSSLRLHRVTAAALDDRLDMSILRRWLKNVENLTVTESQVTSIPCKIGKVFTTLYFLDVSGNHFQDQSISTSFCQGAFPQLQVLKLRHNNLTSYDTVCKALGQQNKLTHLDLSQNNFPQRLSSSSCMWPQTLRVFNLSNTGLEHIDPALPPNIEILDLSANKVCTLDLSLLSLKELYLSNNRLQAVPPVNRFPNLEVLSLDQNQISHLSSKELLNLKHLQSLKAGHNLYHCSCSHIREIQDLIAKQFLLPGWPQDYTCKSPPDYQDFLVKDVPLSSLQCNKALIRHGSMIILLISCLQLVLYMFPV
ncbi:monocyte differentiation antigen CD14 [Hemicordylus capensis]|uniref:monocyte differentiation antigen CD14 n=1 Tax=Hemicordylus capensis TaxID=884348 RepID=UPI0023048208|nr:monocyte differentiation antigen CD14 [Hemicordylus capensis]XP_053169658.1 monocyte differentiation antigen CD14 [Hemicordylus capensis]